MHSDGEKARPDVGAFRQAAGLDLTDPCLDHDSTTGRPNRQTKIAALLMTGQENAIPLRELSRMTGQDGRTVRNRIERERRDGSPILSDNMTGYYHPADEKEISAFVGSMRHRAAEIELTAAVVEKWGGAG